MVTPRFQTSSSLLHVVIFFFFGEAIRKEGAIEHLLYTEGALDVGFEILVDINLLIKRFLEGFRLWFGGMKGFFF